MLKMLIRSGAFFLFVLLGAVTWWRGGRRRDVLSLIGYVLVAALIPGFTQIEAWPFSHWALVHTMQGVQMDRWDLVGLDASGRSFVIDPQVLEPFAPEEFHTWMRIHFLTLGPPARDAVGRDLLRRAEEGRRRFLATGRVGTNDRFLGPLTAPRHFLRGAVWKTSADVPSTPFQRLQIVVSSWDVEGLATDPSSMRQKVLFEYP